MNGMLYFHVVVVDTESPVLNETDLSPGGLGC